MEVEGESGEVDRNILNVLDRWKQDFSSLLNAANINSATFGNETNNEVSDPFLDSHINIMEVRKVVFDAKKGKACGLDQIPYEVLCNDTSISFLHILFNICYNTATVPTIWNYGIINPIPKSSTSDPRNPLSYRGITLACCMYKLYTAVLRNRLGMWCENNGKLVDEQNGFREKRSTIDHLQSLTSIIDNRKKKKLSTFCAFIDFSKAYDYIDRDKLWFRLYDTGVSTKMLSAVRALYNSVSSCVRLNNYHTDWFDVRSGLRQGCSLSTLLFNLFIIDLALKIKSFNIGVPVGNEIVSLLLYADDIVLMAETEPELQFLLNELHAWCISNSMHVNNIKSNVVHFRVPSKAKTSVNFTCGPDVINAVDKYTYLGITLTEFLDYEVTAKIVAQSASRALGLLIAKYKSIGGMPFNVFSKLYDNLVWPVISYGAAIWGTKSYSCISAVQNRAMRFFLGTGKYTPNASLYGDMGWQPPLIKQWKCICKTWFRLKCMTNDRLNKRVFEWSVSNARTSCKNWVYIVKKHFQSLRCGAYAELNNVFSKSSLVQDVSNAMQTKFTDEWQQSVNQIEGNRGRGLNKLRTYRLFKTQYGTERYCQLLLPLKHRSAFAKFRMGVAPLNIEIGRYRNLAREERVCPFCLDTIEDETHAMLICDNYSDIRGPLFRKAQNLTHDFNLLSDADKMKFLFSNQELIRMCAKTCYNILEKRSFSLYRH